jgi:serine/threonine-protein kinase RsbT
MDRDLRDPRAAVIADNTIEIADESDLIVVRETLRDISQTGQLGLVAQTKFITAGSEIARNILKFATEGRGCLVTEQILLGGRHGPRATFYDQGPGIADIDTAMIDGFSTSGSLGLGLPGAKRLVDEMEIHSDESGTCVVLTMWSR